MTSRKGTIVKTNSINGALCFTGEKKNRDLRILVGYRKLKTISVKMDSDFLSVEDVWHDIKWHIVGTSAN